jgi:uncharacterized protein YbjT (DUF2867 family)
MDARPIVTVFGGTGFLGRRIVDHLVADGFAVRSASRHPGSATSADDGIAPVPADVNEGGSIAAAVAGAFAVVNAVGLYREHGDQTFHSVHVDAAARVAKRAREAGVERLVHVSGLGADARSISPYIRSRGRGEEAVRAAFASATIVRPAVMVGPDDGFLNPLLDLLRLPAFALFGRGDTRLQPAYVEDVADAIVRSLRTAEARLTYELGGPRVYTYDALLRTIADHAGLKPVLFPMPFAVWHAIAFAGEFLPSPPVTRNQVELMQVDNVASPDAPGFAALGITPRSVEDVLDEMLHDRATRAS